MLRDDADITLRRFIVAICDDAALYSARYDITALILLMSAMMRDILPRVMRAR